MESVPYNRSIMGQTYLLKVFTPRTLAITFGGVIACIVAFGFFTALGFFVLMFVYQGYLRFGKPAGYDEHVARSMISPKNLRPAPPTFVSPVKESAHEKI